MTPNIVESEMANKRLIGYLDTRRLVIFQNYKNLTHWSFFLDFPRFDSLMSWNSIFALILVCKRLYKIIFNTHFDLLAAFELRIDNKWSYSLGYTILLALVTMANDTRNVRGMKTNTCSVEN